MSLELSVGIHYRSSLRGTIAAMLRQVPQMSLKLQIQATQRHKSKRSAQDVRGFS